MTIQKPKNTPSFVPSISAESVTGLTDAQKTELRTAQETAIRATTGDKLDILKQNLSADTQKVLQDKSIDLKNLVTEKSVMDSLWNAMDSVGETLNTLAQNGKNQVEGLVKKIPAVAAVTNAVDSASEGVSRWKQFWENPSAMLGELWEAIKEAFKTMSFEPLANFFSVGNVLDNIRGGITKLGKAFNLSSAVQESWSELLIDIKEFRGIKLEDLQKYKDHAPADIIANLKLQSAGISENDLKNFVESFFEKNNFEKLQTILTNAGKSKDDIAKLSLEEIMKFAK